MAGFKSTYLINKLLDLYLSNVAWTPPTTLYFALMTTMPTPAGGGVEVSGGGYSRVGVTANLTNFPSASGGSKANATVVTFSTATGPWNTVVGVAMYDAAINGNLLMATGITPKSVIATDVVTIPIGNFTVVEA